MKRFTTPITSNSNIKLYNADTNIVIPTIELNLDGQTKHIGISYDNNNVLETLLSSINTMYSSTISSLTAKVGTLREIKMQSDEDYE